MRAIDISNWQAGFTIQDGAGYDMVIVKATQGYTFTSPTLTEQADAVLKAGLPLGFYHFADGQDCIQEAQNFIRSIKPYLKRCSFLALDWESYAVNKGTGWALKFLNYVKAQTGITPHIYMSQSVTNAYDWSNVSAKYPLWVAAYQMNKPERIGSWSECAMWQYTSSWHAPYDSRNLDASWIYSEEVDDMKLDDKTSDGHSIRYVFDRFTDMGSTKLGARLTQIEKELAEIKALLKEKK